MRRIIINLMLVMMFFAASDIYVCAEDIEIVNEPKTLLMEAGTGTVIKESGGYDRVSQGTLNKLMIVLLAAEEIECGNMSMDSVMTASKNANLQSGAVIWLMPGESITVIDALKSVIVGNANDSSVVIAEEIGGSEEEFVRMMNARAFELGMRNTVYKNVCGYDCDGQYSTAHDTALLCCELLRHEFLYDIMNIWMDSVRGGQTEIVNENKLVRNYNGIIGLKASHSEDSGYCLAMAAERDNKRYISVVMGCDDEDERFRLGKSLMSDGFSYYKVTTPSFSGEFIKPLRVRHGVERAVGITVEKLEGIVIPESSSEISTVVFLPEYLDAPVKKGQRIGSVGFYNGDTLLYETYLSAEESVREITFASSLKQFLHNIYK
ncbi:MAG: D-alanyl-D-alanine carboxypeptidase [Clostridium sp.]|nr:D-alanyl-D-alanine carboxypeptidase [Clostridium sp.]MCM1548009.1 D-alanyl-D-alanine carboxypeptidase [Ruminococcus sp.]